MTADWDKLLEELFSQGLSLNHQERVQLLKENTLPTEYVAKLKRMWQHGQVSLDLDFNELWGTAFQLLSGNDQLSEVQDGVQRKFMLDFSLPGGNMGVVYKAKQINPDREVALKLLPLPLETPERRRRFQQELRAQALLQHPNIVTIYEAGQTQEGRPYFVMEFIEEGMSITEYCDAQSLSLNERIDMFLQVCDGVHYAHQKSLIHRDLKPANILVSKVKGVPKIIDFGLVKFIDFDDAMVQTMEGATMGTPEYMSPEAAEGKNHLVDVRSDIYSLGIILGELLVGTTPFKKKVSNLGEVLTEISRGDLPLPSQLLGSEGAEIASRRNLSLKRLKKCLSEELDWIYAKATAKQVDHRYASVSELAEDLRCYLAGTPIKAVKRGRIYPWVKFVKRHRLAVSMLLLLVGSLMLGLGSTFYMLKRAQRMEAKVSAANRVYEGIFNSKNLLISGHQVKATDLLNHSEMAIERNYSDQPEMKLEAYRLLGDAHARLGNYEKAQKLYEICYPLVLSKDGVDSLNALRIREKIAAMHRYHGALDKALAIFDEILNTYEMHGYRDEKFELLVRLGRVSAIQDPEVAGKELESIYAKYEVKYGRDHLFVAGIGINLAKNYIDRGFYKNAASLCQQSLAVYAQHYPKNHPLVLDSEHNLIEVMRKQGKPRDEVLRRYQDLLANRLETHGPIHQKTLRTVISLSSYYGVLKKPQEGVHLIDEFLAHPELNKYQNHHLVLSLRHNLGDLLMNLGKHEEAEKILDDVFQKRFSLGEKPSKKTLMTLWTIGETFAKRNDFITARTIFEDVLFYLEDHYGIADRDTAFFLGQYGLFLKEQGHHRDAIFYLKRATNENASDYWSRRYLNSLYCLLQP